MRYESAQRWNEPFDEHGTSGLVHVAIRFVQHTEVCSAFVFNHDEHDPHPKQTEAVRLCARKESYIGLSSITSINSAVHTIFFGVQAKLEGFGEYQIGVAVHVLLDLVQYEVGGSHFQAFR
jgi:hypothetical protein